MRFSSIFYILLVKFVSVLPLRILKFLISVIPLYFLYCFCFHFEVLNTWLTDSVKFVLETEGFISRTDGHIRDGHLMVDTY